MDRVKQVSKFKSQLIKFFSNSFYLLFNVGLVVAILLSINILNSVFLGLVLVILAKWRVFAVKAHYWWINLKSAVVDYLAGFSFVFSIYLVSSDQLAVQLAIAGFYLFWLLFIKQQNNERAMAIQSLIVVFWSNLVMSYFMDAIPLIGLMAIELTIGYSITWHYLLNFDFEAKTKRLISGFWGMTMTELLWLNWHWNIGYGKSLLPFQISQFAILGTLLSYLLFIVLEYSYKEESKKDYSFRQFLPSLVFVLVTIAMIVLIFSRPNF